MTPQLTRSVNGLKAVRDQLVCKSAFLVSLVSGRSQKPTVIKTTSIITVGSRLSVTASLGVFARAALALVIHPSWAYYYQCVVYQEGVAGRVPGE
jgi:hypothetical protein